MGTRGAPSAPGAVSPTFVELRSSMSAFRSLMKRLETELNVFPFFPLDFAAVSENRAASTWTTRRDGERWRSGRGELWRVTNRAEAKAESGSAFNHQLPDRYRVEERQGCVREGVSSVERAPQTMGCVGESRTRGPAVKLCPFPLRNPSEACRCSSRKT